MKHKGILSALLALMLALALAVPALATKPSLEEIEYDGGGEVELSFYGRVQYRSPKVTVKDAVTGKKHSARIVERDSDDLTFKANGLKRGRRYTFSVSGLRRRGTSAYGTVKGSFRAYDYDDDDD